MTAGLRLGIDIGGTKTAVALVSDGGRVHALRSAPSGRGPVAVVEVAVRLAREVLDGGGAGSAVDVLSGPGASSEAVSVVSVGACMPGLVDPVSGLARHAVNLGVDALDLGGELSRRLGVRVSVENDVKAAALGAWRLLIPAGSPAGSVEPAASPTLAYLNLGTGLASAVVRDGVVVRGIDGVAGEIGHLPVGGDAPCTCGQVGCLETVASGSALARLWPEGRRRARDPFVAATAGDGLAAAAVDVLCAGVGLAVQVLALASGAERVVVGGGLAGLGEPLLRGVRADLARRGRASRIIETLGLPDRVELLAADVPVAALGAAWLGPGGAGSGATEAPPAGLAVARVAGGGVAEIGVALDLPGEGVAEGGDFGVSGAGAGAGARVAFGGRVG